LQIQHQQSPNDYPYFIPYSPTGLLEQDVIYSLVGRDIMQESVIYRSIQEEAEAKLKLIDVRRADRKQRHNNPVGADTQSLFSHVPVLLLPLNRAVGLLEQLANYGFQLPSNHLW
jgi:hypothetical protein